MKKNTKKSLLYLIIIAIVASITFYYRDTVAFHRWFDQLYPLKSDTHVASSGIYTCPEPTVVLQHAGIHTTFHEKNLDWSFDYQENKPTDQIYFMQAILYSEGNNLRCYYQWPNPQNAATKLWLTMMLNPDADKQIKTYGSHWGNLRQEESSGKSYFMCSSGSVKTCAFTY